MAPNVSKRSLRLRLDKQINQRELDDLVQKILQADKKLAKAQASTQVPPLTHIHQSCALMTSSPRRLSHLMAMAQLAPSRSLTRRAENWPRQSLERTHLVDGLLT